MHWRRVRKSKNDDRKGNTTVKYTKNLLSTEMKYLTSSQSQLVQHVVALFEESVWSGGGGGGGEVGEELVVL